MKKHWLFILAAFMMFGCAGSDDNNEKCGNGQLDAGEECDDGNRKDSDGCSSQCKEEHQVVEPKCGNGKHEKGEQCDDGNKIDDDGCTNACKVVKVIVDDPVCGNSKLENDEDCDDGNVKDNDGCSHDCKYEKEEKCGDGIWTSNEACEDGNTNDGDGCSHDCQIESAQCGNDRKEDGEECDGTDGLPSTCSSWKPTVSWLDGDAEPACVDCHIVAGECSSTLCGNGRVDIDEGEQCDPASIDSLFCSSYDSTKNWKEGGIPTCSPLSCQFEIGTCVEEKCGNGTIDYSDNETCDTADPTELTCSLLDSDKTWKTGGKPVCSSTCQLDAGTCVEDKCGNGFRDEDEGEDCDWNTMGAEPEPYPCAMYDGDKYESGNVTCSRSCTWNVDACVEKKPVTCGNGDPSDDGEECDWGEGVTTKECSAADSNYEANPEITGAMAKCNSCKLDMSECVRKSSGGTGLVWCQTMDPIKLSFDANSADKTVSVRYDIGSDVDVSRMDAKLVYGYDFKTIESEEGTPWTIKDATHNSAEKRFTATLSKTDVTDFWATGDDEVYYTFKISIDGGETWAYCKTDKDNPAVENTSLKPVTIVPDEDPAKFNAHTTGYASYSKILAENILAMFSFDAAGTVLVADLEPYPADSGSLTGCTIMGSKSPQVQCNNATNGGCYASAGSVDAKCMNFKNWITTEPTAASSGAYVEISGLSTTGATGIKLDFDARRNADNADLTKNSPTHIAVYYKTSAEGSYSKVGVIDLKAKTGTTTNKFFPFDIALTGAENQEHLWIQLLPYGGSGYLRLDNIIISKNN